ncbi:hypothetical protein FDP41_010176 [Naegleria fowleri]|uniref:Uncharacterized protein n=1 Tax=Naegleria fowleri TaxID=5763 RepID=A0A6A5BBT5_NAEFO|nr:uncharacterized protein FDP41_010176 [Naegleria fowleri]KAF0971570.1 hypothetical protein FDP41_010176 [Naegleria fowleri]
MLLLNSCPRRDPQKQSPSKPSGPSSPKPTAGGLTAAQLMRCMPNLRTSKAVTYIPYLNAAMKSGNINTCCRRSAFLAQLAHESGDLNWWVEFASGREYEGRRDLGNIYPGDGVRVSIYHLFQYGNIKYYSSTERILN